MRPRRDCHTLVSFWAANDMAKSMAKIRVIGLLVQALILRERGDLCRSGSSP